jgi:hypothetical protein
LCRGDDDVAGFEPLSDDHLSQVIAGDVDRAQRHGIGLGIDDPDRRLPLRAGQGRCRNRDLGSALLGDRSGHRRAEPHCLGRIVEADPDPEGTRHRIGLRRHFAHPPCGPHLGITGQHHMDEGVIGGAALDDAPRNVEHGVAAALARQSNDHAPGRDDLAGLDANRRYMTGGIGDQLGI